MKESNSNSWIIFLTSIGLILIVLSLKTEKPMIMIIAGVVIVIITRIILRKQIKPKEGEK